MRLVEPPKHKGTRPTDKIVFWFLHWYQAKYGETFTYRYQHQLADAAGVSRAALSELFTRSPAWLETTPNSATARDTSEV